MPQNKRERLLIILTGVAVLLFVGDRLVFAPLMDLYEQRNVRIAGLRQSIQKGTSLLDRETALRQRWQGMRTNALPAQRSVAESIALKAFGRWSRESRLTLASMNPQWRAEDEAQPMLEYGAEGIGSLQDITRFLYEVGNDPLGFRVDSVAIRARDTSGDQLSVSLQISALVQPKEATP